MTHPHKYIMDWVDGPIPFSIIPTVLDETPPICDYCWCSGVIYQTSIMISPALCQNPIYNHGRYICNRCWEEFVTENILYKLFNEVTLHLPDVITDLVLEYST
jgi:hypothetical protein